MPPGVQATTVFKAAIGTNAPEPAAATELIAFLKSRKGAQVISTAGMEPA
ncbi:MAG: substrate-binding domain-containing protein [Xanthobacteraceae bacterium]